MTTLVPDTPSPARIALIAYDGVQMSAVLGLGDIFEVANRCARDLGDTMITHTILRPPFPPDDMAVNAVVLPPNISGDRGQGDMALHGWIKARHAAGSVLCSACAGAFWIGHAGLLDGRPATTHWALEEEFRAAFPRVDLTFAGKVA